MALRTQNNAQILTGDTLADRPAAASIPNAGVLFHDTSSGDCSILQIYANGTHAWEPFCTGSSGVGGWPDYVVSLSDPLAPFQSINTAIAAAVANGHGQGDPTIVHVFPGTYTENVVLRAGISVVGFQFDEATAVDTAHLTFTGRPIISGTVTNVNEPGYFLLANIILLAPASTGAPCNLITTQATFVSFNLDRIFLLAESAQVCVYAGGPGGAVSPNATFSITDSVVIAAGTLNSGIVTSLTTTSPQSLLASTVMDRCIVIAGPTNPPGQSAFSAQGGNFNISRSNITGRVHAAFASVINKITDTTVTNVSDEAILINHDATVFFYGGVIDVLLDSAAGPVNSVVLGSGGGGASVFVPQNISLPNSRLLATGSSLTITESFSGTTGRTIAYGALPNALPYSTTITLLEHWDLVTVDLTGQGSGSMVTLPPLATVWPGHVLRVKNIGGSGGVTLQVQASGSENIDGVSGTPITVPNTPSPGGAVAFIPDQISNTWIQVQ